MHPTLFLKRTVTPVNPPEEPESSTTPTNPPAAKKNKADDDASGVNSSFLLFYALACSAQTHRRILQEG
jgi:hypothetical protein